MLIAPSFQTYFGIDPNDKIREAEINGTIVSVLHIGCLFGALIATSTAGSIFDKCQICNAALIIVIIHILDALGRKYSVMLASFVFTVGGIFQIIGHSLNVMYIGRVISGLGNYTTIHSQHDQPLKPSCFDLAINKALAH